MKEMLAVILLLAAVLFLYMSTVGGPEGMKDKVRMSGGSVHETIQRLNP